MCEVTVLQDGYAYMKDGHMYANSTCTLIRSPNHTLIMDTLTPWDGPFIQTKLQELGVSLDSIDFVISSHGHPDHTGNNNLFLKAKHIVGFCIEDKYQFFLHPFEQGVDYVIDDWIKVTPTPGHTNEDVSVVVKDQQGQTIVVAGDLFESELDIETPNLWMGNSSEPGIQATNRLRILKMADVIIPGHGPLFKVQPGYVSAAQKVCDDFDKEAKSTMESSK